MPSAKYEVVFRESVIDRFVEWKLPDFVLDQLEQFVDKQLAVDPVGCLRRISNTGAMECNHAVPDAGAGLVHLFLFRVHYGRDEKSLFVYDAFYYPTSPK
jgi:hypothetical protein